MIERITMSVMTVAFMISALGVINFPFGAYGWVLGPESVTGNA